MSKKGWNFLNADGVWNHGSSSQRSTSISLLSSSSSSFSHSFFLNCVHCLWQIGVICLCELPITRSVRDTYHSEWSCVVLSCNASSLLFYSPPFFSFLFSFQANMPHLFQLTRAMVHHTSLHIPPQHHYRHLKSVNTHSLLYCTPLPTLFLFPSVQSHSLCNLGVHRTIFITALLILSSTLSSPLSLVLFVFLYSNKSASQNPSAVHPFSYP